jgi:hypothetical protein
VVFKLSWRRERTKKDMNETEWKHYHSLTDAQRKLVVPVLGFYKLADGNSVLIQAVARAVQHPTPKQCDEAKRIIEAVGVLHDHVTRNFGYYRGSLRILDVDSPSKRT